MAEILVVDSATQLGTGSAGRVAVCGSHGGLYPAWLAARARVAGIGRHSAGIAGVLWLGGLDIPACAVDYRSARIGDGADVLEHGVVTTVNEAAAVHGCLPGHTTKQAARCLLENVEAAAREAPGIGETRRAIPNSGHRAVWAVDSISLVQKDDRRAIVVSGSHAGLLGGKPDGMLDVDVFAAFFNDAGGGKDDAGFRRLPVLDARGIAAATVSHLSARIGDGFSTYDTGVLSRVNEAAARLDLKAGMSAREAVARLVGLG